MGDEKRESINLLYRGHYNRFLHILYYEPYEHNKDRKEDTHG